MVKIYTKTVCPKCMVAKSFFDNNEVQYETINIEENPEGKQVLQDQGFMAVPIVEYEGIYYQNMAEFQSLVETL